MKTKDLNWPLMSNNITRDDREAVIEFLKKDPILTNGPKVLEFEEAWSKWLGVKYSVFVNSGASANLLTMAWLADQDPGQMVAIPTVTWVSDVASVLQNGLDPYFVDIDLKTLGMQEDRIENASSIVPGLDCIFATHLLGFSQFKTQGFLDRTKNLTLIEDCCESHGATFNGKKLGTFGKISNFSFYYAHHLSTIEGGMICTDDEDIYEHMRTLRSHGLLREMRNKDKRKDLEEKHKTLPSQFVFLRMGYNVRNNEIGAVLGLNQLKRLDENNEKRRQNFRVFLNELSPKNFITDFIEEGSCNYAFTVILKEANLELRDKVESLFQACKVEFRRGLSGGGNQLRQPYLDGIDFPEDYPNANHVSDYGWYIGNYPDLDHSKIKDLCELLNQF